MAALRCARHVVLEPWLPHASALGPHRLAARPQARGVHARAELTPFTERCRKLQRPLDTYRSPGKIGERTPGDSRFVMRPTQPDSEGRSSRAQFSQERAALQFSKEPDELLRHLRAAFNFDGVDPSVIGAAMQRCGQGRWWDALQQVREMQRMTGVVLHPIVRNIYITALLRCVRGEQGFGAVSARQQELLRLARQAWEEAEPATDVDTFNSGVGAALSLCAASEDAAALVWGEEIWESARAQSFALYEVAHKQYVTFLAAHGHFERVDAALSASKHVDWSPDCVLLGALVNVAAERCDWRQAEVWWERLVAAEFGVVPNGICYGARAKAHLLSGRPATAARVIDEMLDRGIDLLPVLAQTQVQALLVVCHSSMAPSDLNRLTVALRRGAPVIAEASARQRATWQRMQEIARRLRSDPAAIQLRDVLVEWTAARSAMATWPDVAVGAAYLKEEDEAGVLATEPSD